MYLFNINCVCAFFLSNKFHRNRWAGKWFGIERKPPDNNNNTSQSESYRKLIEFWLFSIIFYVFAHWSITIADIYEACPSKIGWCMKYWVLYEQHGNKCALLSYQLSIIIIITVLSISFIVSSLHTLFKCFNYFHTPFIFNVITKNMMCDRKTWNGLRN